ncbi:hypothetical protein D6777_00905 [Candidatus Woesearchaeota archaeon]|nr:MAG: hypothetical protein D6777_00905 [Candidatus Woesearchaeota archaeon]
MSPARKTIDFAENSKHTISFTLFNEERNDMRFIVYAEGDMAQYIVLPSQMIELKKTETTKQYTFDIYLPKEMEPGEHITSIVVKEVPYQEDLPQMVIGATKGLIFQVKVNVPYPGKYLKVDGFEISEANKDQVVTMVLPVTNMGTEKLTNIKAKIEILSPTNEVVDTIDTETISLEPQKRNLLKADWIASVNPGKYYAVATIKYDDKSKKVDTTFEVGKFDIEIVKVETKNFKLGSIAKMDITLKNLWNSEVKDLYGVLDIKDENWDKVAEIKTASIDILPLSEEELNAYWDTEGLKEGRYYINLMLHFNGKVLEKHLLTDLKMNSMTTTMLSATGQLVKTRSHVDRTTILTLLVIILAILNITWMVYYKKKR